ncbi:MAG: hypothetical protein Q9221_004631 [Calogaya cf. arnoldii]
MDLRSADSTMPTNPTLHKLCLLCRQIFEGKWIKRTYSPETPTELGFRGIVFRRGYYGLRPYTDILIDPDTGLWQEDDNLQQSNEESAADLSRSIDEFRSQSLESDPDSSDPSLRFSPGDEPDILQRYKAAAKKAPIPQANHLLGLQIIHTGRPEWVKRCQHGDDGEVLYIVPIHHTLQSLRRSTRNECHLCTMLYDKLCNRDSREPKVDAARLENAICVVQCTVDEDDDTICNLQFVYFVDGMFDRESAYVTEEAFDVFPDEQGWPRTVQRTSIPPLQKDDVSPNLSPLGSTQLDSIVKDEESDQVPRTKSPAQGLRMTDHILGCIKKWVRHCLEHHIQCTHTQVMRRIGQSGIRLPSRLLDVVPKHGNNLVTLRGTSGIDTSEKYMTLSHCWGGNLPTRLLSENRTAFEHGIAVNDLPLTFQQAIRFTRLMQCQYLWIDALCIIQDSQKDWLEEAGAMSLIYENAWLNLAATSSKDSSGGLYQPHNLRLSTPLIVQSSAEDNPNQRLVVNDPSAWQRRIEDSPLNHRAWVQQERVLAPRVVHFSYDQIWWQCKELQASEAFPTGIPSQLILKDEQEQLLSFPLAPHVTAAYLLHPRWLKWVEGYSKTDITKDSDRLVATAGIVNAFINMLPPPRPDYLCGIMSEYLAISLLWRVTKHATKLDHSVAPSWSWASVKGEIKFDCGNLEITDPILAPSWYTDSVQEYGYLTANVYGPNRPTRLKTAPRIASDHFAMSVLKYYTPFPHGVFDPSHGGFIRMSAPLHRLKLSEPGTNPSDNRIQFQKIEIDAYETWGPGCDITFLDDESWYRVPDWNSNHKTYFCRFLPKLYPPTDDAEADSNGHSDPDGLDRLTPTGLILEATGQRGEYRRIGWLKTGAGDAWSRLEEHEFLEDRGDGTYVIDIV